jgi:hypothetical protein
MFNLVRHFLNDMEVDIGATDASMLFWFCPLTYCSTEIYIAYHTSGEFFSMCLTLS